jgi:DNA-binding NtrC family response regulator
MMAYSWPGNVRQIKNVIERVIALTPGRQQIEVTDLPEEIQQATEQVAELVPTLPGNGLDLDRYLTGIEYELIRQSLSRTKGNKRQAAQLLGLKRTTLIEKLRRLERSTAMH